MNRWRAEYDDGIWRFYRDGMELGLYEKGDVVVDALNVAESHIAELEAERRWIPVGERLPEDGEVVWLWDGNNLGMGYYLVLTRQFMDRDTPLRRIKPTHWMSLPTPPEVKE